MKKLYLVPDTNFLLHFMNVDEINWKKELNKDFDELYISILSPILREIENHKYSDRKKIRERSSKVIKLFEKGILGDSNSRLKNGATIELFNPPNDFVELDTKNADDQIVHYYKQLNLSLQENESSILLTHDMGMKLKIKSMGLEFHDLGDEFKLKLEKSKEQIELEKVKKELDRLRNRVPKLDLSIEGSEGDCIEFKIDSFKELSQEEIDNEKLRIRQEVPKRESRDSNIFKAFEDMNMQLNRISESEWENYNDKVEKFHNSWEEYYRVKNQVSNFKKRVLPINLKISNQGTLPATNIDIHLHITVCKEVKMLDEYQYNDLLDELGPYEPSKPSRPKTMLENISIFTNNNYDLYRPTLTSDMISSKPVNVSSPNIRPTNSYDVTIDVKNLKHHSTESLETMYLVFPSHEYVDSFRIEYQLLCDELPSPYKGVIHFNNKTVV